jgi:hypothetical protein
VLLAGQEEGEVILRLDKLSGLLFPCFFSAFFYQQITDGYLNGVTEYTL